MRIGNEIEKGLYEMQDFALDSIKTMKESVLIAANALNDLNEEFLKTKAGKKTVIFVLGAID